MASGNTILFVSEFAGAYGGIEQAVRQSAQVLRKAGYRMELLYRSQARQPEEYLAAFDKHATNVDDLSPAPRLVLLHRLWDADLTEKLLQRHGQRIALLVHDHETYCPRRYYYTPFGRRNCARAYEFLRCGFCGLAVAPRHWQGGLIGMLPRKFTGFRRLFQLARKMPRLIVLSDFMRQNLLRNGFALEQILVLPPIVPAPDAVRLPDPKHFKAAIPCIGFAGQLLRGKGADLFLDTVQILRAQDRPFRAILAGEGPEYATLEKEIATRHLEIEMHGFLPDLSLWYPQCDFLMLPFRWQEPFGLVGAEAAACAVPVIAPDLGGVQAWMQPEKTGLLVSSGTLAPSPPEAFAKAANQLLASPELCAQLGRQARAFAIESFSPARFLQNFERILP